MGRFELHTGQMKCFLCLKSLPRNISPDTETDTECQNLVKALRSIFRYVQVEERLYLGDSFCWDKGLCSECSDHFQKFDQLYVILEETRLLMAIILSDVVRVMNEADGEARIQSPSSAQYHSTVVTGSECVDPLREQLMSKCVQKLGSSIPRVTLERLPEAPQHVQTQDASDSASCTGNAPSEVTNVPSTSTTALQTDDASLPPQPDNQLVTTSTSIPTLNPKSMPLPDTNVCSHEEPQPLRPPPPLYDILADLIPEAPPPPPNQKATIICPHCCNSVRLCDFNAHYFRRHRELSLLPFKKKSVSAAQFKEIVDKELFPSLLKSYGCSFCQSSWAKDGPPNVTRTHFLTSHMLETHLHDLGRILMVLQQRTETERKMSSGTVHHKRVASAGGYGEWGKFTQKTQFIHCRPGIRKKELDVGDHQKRANPPSQVQRMVLHPGPRLMQGGTHPIPSLFRIRPCLLSANDTHHEDLRANSTSKFPGKPEIIDLEESPTQPCPPLLAISDAQLKKPSLPSRQSRPDQRQLLPVMKQPQRRPRQSQQCQKCNKCGKAFLTRHLHIHQLYNCAAPSNERRQCSNCKIWMQMRFFSSHIKHGHCKGFNMSDKRAGSNGGRLKVGMQ